MQSSDKTSIHLLRSKEIQIIASKCKTNSDQKIMLFKQSSINRPSSDLKHTLLMNHGSFRSKTKEPKFVKTVLPRSQTWHLKTKWFNKGYWWLPRSRQAWKTKFNSKVFSQKKKQLKTIKTSVSRNIKRLLLHLKQERSLEDEVRRTTLYCLEDALMMKN